MAEKWRIYATIRNSPRRQIYCDFGGLFGRLRTGAANLRLVSSEVAKRGVMDGLLEDSPDKAGEGSWGGFGVELERRISHERQIPLFPHDRSVVKILALALTARKKRLAGTA